jgi:hypothetical protein
LLLHDKLWQDAISADLKLAKDFHLDALLSSKETDHVKVGEALGSLLITKIPEIELRDFVNEDLSMQRVS